MTTTMKLNKFDNFKNKIISLEKKRFSRLQDELKTKKSNLEEDLKEIDAIMKETFTKNMSDETEVTAIVSIDEVQNDNDAFFDN
jgi:hypothetical protein